MNTIKGTGLQFEELKFYFIYNFLFAPEGWKDINGKFTKGVPRDRLGWIPTFIPKGLIDYNKYCYLAYSDTETVSSSSERKDEKISICWTQSDELKTLEATLHTLLRLRKSGSGSISFCINTITEKQGDKIFTIQDLEPFMRLTPRTWTHIIDNEITTSGKYQGSQYLAKIKFTNSESEQTLFDLFLMSLADLRDTHKIKPMNFFLPTMGEDEYLFGILKPKIFDEDIQYLSPKTSITPNTFHPYLYTSAKVSSDIYQKLINHKKSPKPSETNINEVEIYTKQIAAILFRFFEIEDFWQCISPDYIYSELDCISVEIIKLVSHNTNNKFFSHFYRMAAISLYSDDQGIPYEMLSKSILDVLENGRAKWFGLMYVNILLDEIIYSIENLKSLAEQELGYLFRSLLAVERLITLSLADPNIYLHDGHVAFDITKLVGEKMKVKDINDLVLAKLGLVKQFIADVESRKYSDFIEEKEQKILNRIKYNKVSQE